MVAAHAALLAVTLAVAFAVDGVNAQAPYTLSANYTGDTFFDQFDFWTDDDPTNGYVDYVSRENATNWGFIRTDTDGTTFVGCDAWSVSSGRGRGSVRLQSKQLFGLGTLLAMDVEHMPQGCATWPAWWLCGPDWPAGGEVDIIEGINTMTNDHTTLHTNEGCSMAPEANASGTLFTGSWAASNTPNQPATDCWVGDPNQSANQGCSIVNTASPNSYGVPFNAQGGGYVVAELTHAFIRMFYFPRSGPIPADLVSGNPQPTTWPMPYAYFTLNADSCDPAHFRELQMIINLTFCGDWAGSDFPQSCPNKGSCQSFTQNTPTAFQEAFWSIRSIAIYSAATSRA